MTTTDEKILAGLAKPLLHPSITPDRVERMVMDNMFGLSNDGICKHCGETQDGCEPDAQGYYCEDCGHHAVYGAEELLMEIC